MIAVDSSALIAIFAKEPDDLDLPMPEDPKTIEPPRENYLRRKRKNVCVSG